MSDTNVISIGLANSLPPGEVCQPVIDLLRAWLADAEAGELIQIMMAGVKPSGGIRTQWAGIASMNMSLAAAAGLHARVGIAWSSGADE